MSLKGNGVRIIVHEPTGWSNNLFGIVKHERGESLLVELYKPLRGKFFTSALIELKPKEIGSTFKPLSQYYSVFVVGALVNTENTNDTEEIFMGTVTVD